MQTIEFETHLTNGLIHLPLNYQHWQEGKSVKVIVLIQEEPEKQNMIQSHAGKDKRSHREKNQHLVEKLAGIGSDEADGSMNYKKYVADYVNEKFSHC